MQLSLKKSKSSVKLGWKYQVVAISATYESKTRWLVLARYLPDAIQNEEQLNEDAAKRQYTSHDDAR